VDGLSDPLPAVEDHDVKTLRREPPGGGTTRWTCPDDRDVKHGIETSFRRYIPCAVVEKMWMIPYI
jgi:hypothetical protein